MKTFWSLLLPAALAAVLSACGGGGDAANGFSLSPGAGSPDATPSVGASLASAAPTVNATKKVLLIGIDGLNIEHLHDAILRQQLPALGRLTLGAAYTGGVAGTVTQQDILDGPGWATILTGTWANRHEVRSDAPGQTLQADTIFHRIAVADPAHKAMVAAGSAQLAGLLQADARDGRLSSLVDCEGVDLCVATSAGWAVAHGEHDLIVANFHALAPIASTRSDVDYRAALKILDAHIGALLDAIDSRQKAIAGEEWLVLATADRGQRAKDSPSSSPQSARTTFIALNKPANPGFRAIAPTDLYDYPSAADIAPTVLDFMGLLDLDPGRWFMDGQSLVGAPGAQQLRINTVTDAPKALRLDWRLAPGVAPQSAIRIYRNGKQIQTLPPDATTWTDVPPGLGADGERKYFFDYVVMVDNVPSGARAEIDYVDPVDELSPALLGQLRTFVSFDGGLSDAKGGSGLTLLKPALHTMPTYVDDGFSGKALVIDPKLNSYVMDADWSGRPQFTIGLWFRSDGKQAWLPVVTNKNWASGEKRGVIISQTNMSNGLTFNVGDGKKRADATLTLAANQWVYVAMSIDTLARTGTAYVGIPGQKLQSKVLDLADLDMTQILPAGPLVFNEDATGKFYDGGYAIGKVAPQYNDIAVWSRLLSPKEIGMLYTAGKSLTTLSP